MTMTITVNDSFADQVIAFLKTLPQDAVEVESSRTWYADEVKCRVEKYKSGKMETVPHNEMWERIERQIGKKWGQPEIAKELAILIDDFKKR